MWIRRVLAPAVAVLLTVGCAGGKMPKTHEVKGTVTYKDGKVLEGGSVRLQSQGASDVTISGDIGPDGKFTVSTIGTEGKTTGAPEGQYTLSVTAPMGADRSVPALIVTKPSSVTVKPGESLDLQVEVVKSR